MGQNILFGNNTKVDSLKNYLYNNRLAEKEIDRELTNFAEYFYVEGLEHGDTVCKNNAKRIKVAIKKCRDSKFEKIFALIDDEHDELILSKKKKK